MSNNFIDVMRIAKKMLPNLEKYSQISVSEHYGIKSETAHRAMNDCETCNSIFNRLKEDVLNKYQSISNFKNVMSK